MMFFLFLSTPVLLSLLLDWLIYRRIKLRYPDKPWAKRFYLGQAIILYGVALIGMLFWRQQTGTNSESANLMLGWTVLLLFASILPKLLYMIVSLLDYPAGWMLRRKFRWFARTGVLLGVCMFGLIVWGATEGRSRIRVVEVEIVSDRLPPAFDGYRIAQITDVHLGNYAHGNTLVERVVERVNALRPDLIVNTGDLVNLSARELTQRYMAILSDLEAPDGVFTVLGNHDLGGYMRADSAYTPAENLRELAHKLRRMDWRLLTNETVRIHRGEESIALSGVNYPAETGGRLHKLLTGLEGMNLELVYRDLSDSLFNLVLAHTPMNWDEIRSRGAADLTLSGHVHAMQMKVPLGKRGWSPAKWMYDRWSGLYEEEGRYLYINDGIGYAMFPLRMGTRPEITLFTLRRPKK